MSTSSNRQQAGGTNNLSLTHGLASTHPVTSAAAKALFSDKLMLYRVLSLHEQNLSIERGAVQPHIRQGPLPDLNNPHGLKFLSRSPKYSLFWKSQENTPDFVSGFEMDKKYYLQFEKTLRSTQDPNVNYSHIHRVGRKPVDLGKRPTLGLKQDDVQTLNRCVKRVTALDDTNLARSRLQNLMASNRGAAGAVFVQVALTAVSVTIGVHQDNGKFGKQTTAAITSSVAAAAATALTAAIPGIGSIAGAIIALVLGSLAAHGASALTLKLWNEPVRMESGIFCPSLDWDKDEEVLVDLWIPGDQDRNLFDHSDWIWEEEAWNTDKSGLYDGQGTWDNSQDVFNDRRR